MKKLKGMATQEHATIRSRTTGQLHEIKFPPMGGGLVSKNPFASLAQERFMNAHPEKLGEAKLQEFNTASKGMKLPKKVKK